MQAETRLDRVTACLSESARGAASSGLGTGKAAYKAEVAERPNEMGIV